MTASTDDRRSAHPARRAGEAPANRRTPPRTAAFVLLSAACVALAGGYAWWSTARRASFVREVSLPPIGSLAELDAPAAREGSAPPVGEDAAQPAGVGTARPTGVDPAPDAGAGSAMPTGAGSAPEETGSAPLTETGSASPQGAAGSTPRPADPRGDPAAPDAATTRPAGDRLGAAGRSSHASDPDLAADMHGPMPGRGDPASGAGGPAAPDVDDHRAGRALLFRHTGLDESFGVASVERLAGGGRRATPLRCDRVDFAGERGVCLTTDRFYTTHAIMVFDGAFEPLHRLPLHGVPSRVRLAPDGRLAAVTVFVSGHSYLDEGFSTETSIVDTYSGERRIANLEELGVYRDGAPFRAVDFNFWGVTFAADGDRFYATLGTGGTTHLVEGRVSTRRADVVVEGVECPSLSPDQRRIVFKKRLPLAAGLGWRLHVMDLRSGAVTPLAERRSVDDQAEWLDDSTILYALPDASAPTPMVTDVWRVRPTAAARRPCSSRALRRRPCSATGLRRRRAALVAVPADGGGAPALLLAGASSPAVLRQECTP